MSTMFFVEIVVITELSARAIIHIGPTDDREDCPCFDGIRAFLHDAFQTYEEAVEITQEAPGVTVKVVKCCKCFPRGQVALEKAGEKL